MALDGGRVLAAEPAAAERLYEQPAFGNVSVLHFTDCHAQLLPLHFREPHVNIGVGPAAGKPPHLVGERLLKAFDIRAARHAPMRSRTSTSRGREDLRQGRRLRAPRDPDQAAARDASERAAARRRRHLAGLGDRALDEGPGHDRCRQAARRRHHDRPLGVHLRRKRVQEVVENDYQGRIAFLAQNVKTTDFGDPVFPSYDLRTIKGVPVAVIGQAFPYTPIANPRYFVPDWTFGIQDENLQNVVDEVRAKGAQVVVLLSHNGMDVDLKLASRVSGIDAILGGHTHDGVPEPSVVQNRGGKTLVTNAGSHGKFLAVLDLDVRDGKVQDFRYRLLPVFANLLPADREMQAHIDRVRARRSC
jgi:sulfur-oxidizing protein SoxB